MALALVATSCVRHVGTPDAADDGGHAWYVHACASCHGEAGRGDGPVAKALIVPPPDITTLTLRSGEFPRADVIAVIAGERELPAHGTREMPVWSQRFGTGSGPPAVASLYARRRLEALADYVASLQRPAP